MRKFPPRCGCAKRSSRLRVFTCPVCIAAALRRESALTLVQEELFEGRESVSVSALSWPSDMELDALQETTEAVEDGLPF